LQLAKSTEQQAALGSPNVRQRSAGFALHPVDQDGSLKVLGHCMSAEAHAIMTGPKPTRTSLLAAMVAANEVPPHSFNVPDTDKDIALLQFAFTAAGHQESVLLASKLVACFYGATCAMGCGRLLSNVTGNGNSANPFCCGLCCCLSGKLDTSRAVLSVLMQQRQRRPVRMAKRACQGRRMAHS